MDSISFKVKAESLIQDETELEFSSSSVRPSSTQSSLNTQNVPTALPGSDSHIGSKRNQGTRIEVVDTRQRIPTIEEPEGSTSSFSNPYKRPYPDSSTSYPLTTNTNPVQNSYKSTASLPSIEMHAACNSPSVKLEPRSGLPRKQMVSNPALLPLKSNPTSETHLLEMKSYSTHLSESPIHERNNRIDPIDYSRESKRTKRAKTLFGLGSQSEPILVDELDDTSHSWNVSNVNNVNEELRDKVDDIPTFVKIERNDSLKELEKGKTKEVFDVEMLDYTLNLKELNIRHSSVKSFGEVVRIEDEEESIALGLTPFPDISILSSSSGIQPSSINHKQTYIPNNNKLSSKHLTKSNPTPIQNIQQPGSAHKPGSVLAIHQVGNPNNLKSVNNTKNNNKTQTTENVNTSNGTNSIKRWPIPTPSPIEWKHLPTNYRRVVRNFRLREIGRDAFKEEAGIWLVGPAEWAEMWLRRKGKIGSENREGRKEHLERVKEKMKRRKRVLARRKARKEEKEARRSGGVGGAGEAGSSGKYQRVSESGRGDKGGGVVKKDKDGGDETSESEWERESDSDWDGESSGESESTVEERTRKNKKETRATKRNREISSVKKEHGTSVKKEQGTSVKEEQDLRHSEEAQEIIQVENYEDYAARMIVRAGRRALRREAEEGRIIRGEPKRRKGKKNKKGKKRKKGKKSSWNVKLEKEVKKEKGVNVKKEQKVKVKQEPH
ncbi:hypothetical protein M231_04791 [Tremella mesenterica]|uniref:Uncharacterized protein n=1 Tax=Tremella mesenterica TaxID=5217 RepID=A0A4Q1BJY6_TREME|nr:hypothetical protein M231_04791 [Tremella mesenterica]